MPTPDRREFLSQAAAIAGAVGTVGAAALAGCGGGGGGGGESGPAQPSGVSFDHGVASGDPLADRVILWTRARRPDSSAAVDLQWEIAGSADFAPPLVASGALQATAASDFTVKVDAIGLAPGRDYWYRFRAGAITSPTGRTRTLPAGALAELRLAVMSCANHPAGFFSVYAEVARSNAQFLLHLGDAIYEYGAGGYATGNATALGRVPDPAHEIVTLDDYRRRWAQYRSDADCRAMHAAAPLIAVWDDHEFANNAWRDGASNHSEGPEGSFAARRAAALQAWHEWMPVRSTGDPLRIWRGFDFGDLVALHMLDTRLVGRERGVRNADLLSATLGADALALARSPTRQMLGAVQQAWLESRLAAPGARWQVLGQQVLMARMELPRSLLVGLDGLNGSTASRTAVESALAAYTTARAKQAAAETLSAAEAAVLDRSANPLLGYNMDAWDGYAAQRDAVLAAAARSGRPLVVLSGDTHNAWHNELTLADGRKVGEEFATASVSSPGFEVSLAPLPPATIKTLFESLAAPVRWMDPSRRGFLLMTFTREEVQAQWSFVDRVDSRSYTLSPPAAAETRRWRPD